MNNQEIVALIRGDITTIECRFIESGGSKSQKYTFFCKDTLAKSLKEGDLMLVESAGNEAKVAEFVEESDKIGTGSLSNSHNYKYAYAKVDTGELQALKDEDAKYETLIKDKRRRTARQELLRATGLGDSDLQALTGTTVNQ